jgi:type IV pilus assembly protein PilE
MRAAGSRPAKGVTLIELMVVIVVLAILVSISVPSYRNYMRRAQRSDAKAELLRVRSVQEKFFLQNNFYADTAALTARGLIGPSEHGHYTVDLPNVTKTTFTVRATAVGGQLEDVSCRTFTVNELGVSKSTTAAGIDSTTTCWR